MAWAVNGTPETLTGAGPNLEITDLTGKIFNQILAHTLIVTNAAQDFTFNSDSSSLYARRNSNNGGSDVTGASLAFIDLRFNSTEEYLQVIYSCWISGEEKLSLGSNVGFNVAGASNAPSRKEFVFKYVPSPLTDTIDAVKLNKGAFTNYATDSNISVLSTD